MPGFDPERHHRRSIRLQGHDYALAGVYYVTICVQGGMCLLCDVTREVPVPNPAGDMVEVTWGEVPQYYPGADVDAFVVMPNHVHGIILLAGEAVHGEAGGHEEVGGHGGPPLQECTDGQTGAGLSLSQVVQRWKALTTARYGVGVRERGWEAYAGRLWQRGYYERIVRNARELNAIRSYIQRNPFQWQADRENPACGM